MEAENLESDMEQHLLMNCSDGMQPEHIWKKAYLTCRSLGNRKQAIIIYIWIWYKVDSHPEHKIVVLRSMAIFLYEREKLRSAPNGAGL